MNSPYTATELRKVFAGVIVKAGDVQGEVTALVNTTGVRDKQGDTMEPGCYGRVIREKQQPAMAWSHDTSQIIGKVVEMEELMPGDPRLPADYRKAGVGALFIKGLFALATQAGRDAWELVRGNFIREWSVQFSVDPDQTEQRGHDRSVKEVYELFEVSPVLRGASPGTLTLATKAAYERATTGSYREAEQLAQRIGADVAAAVIEDVDWEWSGEYMTRQVERQIAAEVQQRAEDLAWIDARKGFDVWAVPVTRPTQRKPETEDEKWVRLRSGIL